MYFNLSLGTLIIARDWYIDRAVTAAFFTYLMHRYDGTMLYYTYYFPLEIRMGIKVELI